MSKKNKFSNPKEKRTIFFGAVRLTKTEYDFVENDFQKSEYSSRSAYMRAKIFDKKVSDAQQKKHQAFLSAAKMNTEINKIGINFNQLVHGINTYKTVQLRSNEVKIIQELNQKLKKLFHFFDDLEL